MGSTQDNTASIQGVGIRVTRLDPNGELLNSAGDSYTTAKFIQVTFTPEYEAGEEIVQKLASGAVGVTYQAPDTLKRITMELAICEPDPELTSLISGGLLLRKEVGSDTKSVGWAAPGIGDDPAGNGVAIEAWSLAVKAGKKASSLPYYHWIFPYAKLRQSGDRVIENGLLATTFEGFGLGNIEFGRGPDERWEWPVAAERCYSYARSAWAPSGLDGYYTWHGDLEAVITNVVGSGTVATITTEAAHGFAINDVVTVAATTATTLNGTFTVVSVPTATTFTYSSAITLTTAADTGSATVARGSRAVADLDNVTGSTSTDYNVPGNTAYVAENPLDYIITSVEDET